MSMNRRTSAAGFTLFEMLVAVALFALMAMLAYGGLERVLTAREAVEREAARWRDLEALFNRLQQDVQAALPRPVRNEFGVVEPAFQGERVLVGRNAANLWMVRAAADGPPQRIGYRLRDDVLEFLQWESLDQPPRAQPRTTVLWRGVKRFDIQYMDTTGWSALWPPNQSSRDAMPRAIEVTVAFDDGLEVQRVLLLK